MISNDDEFDIVQGGYRAVSGLKRQNPKLKVLISVGEAREDRSNRFTNMVSSAGRRRDFIRSVIHFMENYDFDGLDIAWQYPGAEELGGHITDKEYLGLFLEELSEIFVPRGWLLTLLVPANRFRIGDGYVPAELANLIDFVNLQAYDFHKDREPVADHHANLSPRPDDSGLNIFNSVDYAVNFWLKKGLPRSKLVVGLPFYGRTFTLQNANDTDIGAPIRGPGREGFYTQHPGLLAYFEICDLIINEGWYKTNDESGAPYAVNGDQWVGFDDPESLERKVNYVKQNQLGGVSIWTTDMDDFKGLCGEKWPLLNTVNKFFKGPEYPTLHADLNPPTKPYGTCKHNGFYSDPRNCGAYYVCKNRLSYHLSCGDKMMFDPATGKCDYISIDKCSPGHAVYIPNSLKEIEVSLSNSLSRIEVSKTAGPKVVCYMTNWSFYRKGEGKFVPEHIDQTLCTHVVYAFSSLDPEKLLLKEFDPWADLDNNLYERVTALQDTKVLLSLGGWTDSAGDKYSRLVSDGSARRRFVVGVVGFLRRHGFQGLHFDWNYPVCWQSNCKKGPASDKPNFTKLVQELRQEFNRQSPRLILAAAISGYKEVIDVSYDLPMLGQSLDFISVMTYDYHGAWERQTGHVSPLYGQPGDKYPQYNTNYTMQYLLAKGAPREKLIMGVPFYGQTFTLSKPNNYGVGIPSAGPGEAGEFTKQPGMLAYYEICSRIRNNRWIVNRDPTGPFAHAREQWVGFEDVDSVKVKADYIKTNGFGGAVAWTIDLDDFSNRCCEGTFPLLRGLNEALGRVSHVPHHGDCTKPPEPSTPAPPQTTTGVDSGASSSEHHHGEWTTEATKPTTTKPWWTTTTRRPTKPTTTSPWWTSTSTTTTTTTSTTTRRPTTTSAPYRPPSTTPPIWERPPGTTIPPPAVIMPEVDKPMQQCEPGQYLPDKQNCNAFYRCVLGELRKQYCAGGLHWNREKNICDWPLEAKCREEMPSYVPTTTTTQRPTTWQSWQTKPTQSYYPTTSSTEKAPGISQLVEETCNTGQYYPHESCTNFYVCVNNNLVGQSCAPGLSWNAEVGICDWTYRVKCLGRKRLAEKYTYNLIKGSPQPYSSCTEGSFAGMSGDCNQYMHCLWGKYEVYQCAPGLHWNNDKHICDWPAISKCKDNSVEGSNPSYDPVAPPYKPPTTTPETTTNWEWKPESTTQWKPPSTTESTGGAWEWHPPIPPTSEQPPLSEELKPQSGYFKVVCYFTNWAWYRKGLGKYLPEDIHPDLCTHIVYGFAVLDFENLIIKAHDSWADFDNQFYKRVVAFKEKGVKVSIAIGGWNDSQGDKYSRLVNNPAARARFITNILAFLEKHNFDGLDLDWEYPKCWQVDCKKGPDSDKESFAAFVTELKTAFRPKGYLLSAATSPSKTVIDAGYNVPVLAENLDWVAVMTYDFHGQWDKQTGHVAPLYYHPDDSVAFYNTNYSINYWISEGVPRRKIVMGMPLYGQSFMLGDEANNGLNAPAPGPGEAGEFTRAAGFLAYYEICDNIKNKGWTVVKDPERRLGPYAYKGNQWVSFDDQEMIRIKSEYIRKMDLGGGMIWALDLDDFKNRCGEGRHPLLTVIRNVLADPGTGTAMVPQAPFKPSSPQPIVEAEHQELNQESLEHPDNDIFDQNDSEYKVVCYFSNWAWLRQGSGKYYPNNVDPELCTHIVYATAVLDKEQLIIKPLDTWTDIENKFYEKITEFRSKGIKVLLSIGGFADSSMDKYSRLVHNHSSRRKFITHAGDFLRNNNFDGLDVNWQYPKCWQSDCSKGPDSDKEAFSDFIRELSTSFRPKGLLLSASISPSTKVIAEAYELPELTKYVSWLHLMTKDFHGEWEESTGHVAPMYARPEDDDPTYNANYSVNYLIDNGVDRRKLIMGIPLYGNSFTLADPNQHGLYAATVGSGEAGDQTKTRGFLAYYEICNNILKKEWNVVRDRKGRVGPYAYKGNQWVGFDDIGMIRHKSEYIKAMGLGGGVVWALDLDDFKNECGCEKYPLLRTVNRVLRNYAKPAPKCVLGRPQKKPTTMSPLITTPVTISPANYNPSFVVVPLNETSCVGKLFMPSDKCNEYYVCNQGQLLLQSCPGGLFWSRDHCDWPENTACHPDVTTPEPVIDPVMEVTTSKPIYRPPITPPSVPGTSSPPGDYKVVCYFTNWAWYRQGDGKYLPSDIDASLCTHIAYGFAVLDANTLTLKPHDTWADIDNDFYKKVTDLRSKGVKVVLALGGWNDSLGNKYSRLVNDPGARSRFIQHAMQFIEKWNFDGLDLDWEYPKCWQVDCNKGPASDKQGFAALVTELSNAFKPKGLLLSSAVSPSKAVIDAGYDVPTLSNHFDWIAVMTYDFHGHWDKQTGHVAPLYYYPGDTYDYFNANFTINYWIEKGASPKKLVMGMPLYGQSFSLADTSKLGLNEKTYGPGEAGEFTRAGGFLAFYEICERVKRGGWTVKRDPLGRIGPYAYRGNQWVSYDDVSEIKRKSQLVKDLGLGGGMVWALDLDDFRNKCGCGKHPLLKAMNRELRGMPAGEFDDCT
ncbi:unnamed protein product [Brassicogethes aeneus]|uniref:chitinase n=1 Tax=Brassicogethes aeneus TaxID=1431903 RepID=A0A9P0B373_BRAAE|nr:unnamed protein product [Brassicogethes aeneus]